MYSLYDIFPWTSVSVRLLLEIALMAIMQKENEQVSILSSENVHVLNDETVASATPTSPWHVGQCTPVVCWEQNHLLLIHVIQM